MNAAAAPIDLIKLEILSNALRSISDETFIALMRSAYSTTAKSADKSEPPVGGRFPPAANPGKADWPCVSQGALSIA